MFTIGCHLSSAKGYLHMAKDAVSIDANTFQFFTRNRAAAVRRPSTRKTSRPLPPMRPSMASSASWRTRLTR